MNKNENMNLPHDKLSRSVYINEAEQLRVLINKIKKESFNKILSLRTDGTTERLNSIIHGLYLSEHTGWPFEFCWRTDVGAAKNPFHSIGKSVPDFFNDVFINEHYKSFDVFTNKYSMKSADIPYPTETGGGKGGLIWAGRQVKKVPTPAELKNEINIISPPRLIISDGYDTESIVKKVISQEYFDFKDSIKNKASSYVALHYRGGDVIYGMHRHTRHAIGNKSVALALLEKYIQENSSDKFILFGTPVGDTQKDMEYITNKYTNVILVSEFCDVDLHPMVQECFIMASCKKIVAMSGTGVTYFAQLINRKVEVVYFNHIVKGIELYNLLIQGLNNLQYNNLQRSYHALRALSINDDDKELLVAKIKELDPANKLSWLTK
jgi:hypothetical protein